MERLQRLDEGSLMRWGYRGAFFSVPVATSPAVAGYLLVLAVWIISGRFLVDLREWTRSHTALPVAALALLPWVGLLYSPTVEDGLHIASKSHLWLLAIALPPLLRRVGSGGFIKAYLAGLSLNSLISILQLAGLVPLKKGLTTGLLGGSSAYIAYSLLLTTGILCASFCYREAQTRGQKALYGCLMLQFFFTISFNAGRSGYAAFILLSPLVAYNIAGKRNMLKMVIVACLSVVLLLASPVVQSRLSKAAEDITLYRQGIINTSVGTRLHIWRIALEEIGRHPLTGIGTGGFSKSWERYKGDPGLPFFDHPHNSYLYMAVSFGIPGAAAFCWLLWVMLRLGWRARATELGFGALSFTAVFAIGSLTDTQLLPFATAVALPLFAGAAEAASAG